MGLVDDAREMTLTNVAENFDLGCPFCGMTPSLHNVEGWSYVPDSLGVLHYPGCPWLSLPRIVAALEAAVELVTAATTGAHPVGGEGPMPYREWQALVRALGGGEAGE